ncbi:MAG: DUF1552 domain-containing protein, partial [Myxococcota bacterium]
MSWSRRAALRGAAATLWLPFLPSILPREARAAFEPAPRRFVFWFLPHGMQHIHVAPGSPGAYTQVTQPVEALSDRISVVTRLNNPHGNGAHGRATASLLTDAPGGYALQAGISVDQVAARANQAVSAFPSLQLAVDAPGLFNSNEGILSSRVSWADVEVPLAPTLNPKATFDQLFQGTDLSLSAQEAERRRRLRHSVLDAVKERVTGLEPRLSTADRVRLDQYATGLRELEQRIDLLSARQCEAGELRIPDDVAYMEAVALMAELQRLAFACDLTRVITFMFGPSASDITLPELGITSGSHQLSHAWSYNEESNQDFQA